MTKTVLERTLKSERERVETAGGDLAAWNPLEAIVLPAVRSWLLIVLTGGLGLLAGIFLAFVKPNEYESHAKIHVKPWLGGVASVESVVSGEAGELTPNADIANQFHLLTSEEVFMRVARALGPIYILQPYDPAADDDPEATPFLLQQLHRFQSWWFGATNFNKELLGDTSYQPTIGQVQAAVDVLKNNTEISSDGHSNIIDVRYRTHDGRLAQTILQAILAKHEERHLEINSVKPVTEFWKSEQERHAIRHQEATEELNRFRDEHQISDLDKQIADLFSEKERLQRELDFGDQTIHDYHIGKLEALKEEFKDTKEIVRTEDRVGQQAHPDYTLKYNQIQNEKQKRLAMEGVYQLDSDEVRFQDAKIERLESEASEMEKTIAVPIPGIDVANPDWSKLKEKVEQLSAIVEEGDLTIRTKKSRLGEVTNRLSTLRGHQNTFNELHRETQHAENLKNNYEAAIERLSLTRQLEEESQSNLTIWTPPTMPFTKSGPQRIKLVVASAGGGVLAGFALALVLNAMDRSIRRRKALEALLGVPCITVIPMTGKWSWRQARRAAKKFPVGT